MPIDSTRSTLKVAVICGGKSSESAVSRSSAHAVATALRTSFLDVREIELNESLLDSVRAAQPDVVFPVLHGSPGEDGTVQGFLEILGIPYVGSGVTASACAINKYIAKQLFRAAHLPVADDMLIPRANIGSTRIVNAIRERLGIDLVVKPVDQGSTIGVSYPSSDNDILTSINECWEIGSAALIEQRRFGREVTVAVIDLSDIQALPAIEIRTENGLFNYAQKYQPGAARHIVPAEISQSEHELVKSYAMRAHLAMGCRDFSRSDFILSDTGDFTLLEINTLPGMTPTSLFPDALRAAGLEMDLFFRDAVVNAFSRSHKSALRK